MRTGLRATLADNAERVGRNSDQAVHTFEEEAVRVGQVADDTRRWINVLGPDAEETLAAVRSAAVQHQRTMATIEDLLVNILTCLAVGILITTAVDLARDGWKAFGALRHE